MFDVHRTARLQIEPMLNAGNYNEAILLAQSYPEVSSDFFLAIIHRRMGDLPKSIEYSKAVLARIHEFPELALIAEASCHNSLGLAYLEEQSFAEAAMSFKTAFEIFKKENNQECVSVVQCNMGILAWKLGDVEKAKKVFIKASDGDSSGRSHMHIGAAYLELGDLNSAEPFIMQALDQLLATYGPGHPDTALAYFYAARIHGSMGELSRAVEEVTISARVLNSVLGTEHENTHLVMRLKHRLEQSLYGPGQ